MKKPPFLENQIYHIYNRGVEKRNVFTENIDYVRFIHCLFEFNNIYPPPLQISRQMSEVEPLTFNEGGKNKTKKQRKLLVEIFAFCLMPNHYHLIVRQKVEGGIVKFMHKLGTGYTMYFNQKYNRVGSLFQGRFKAVMLQREAHFLYLPHYVHLNPIYLYNVRGSTSDIGKRKFLEEYRWSSFPDYIGKKNFPSVTQRNFFLEKFGGIEGYRKDIDPWLEKSERDFRQIKEILLD